MARRPRAVLVADPGASSELIATAKLFLRRGAAIVGFESAGGDLRGLELLIDDRETDLLVVLRSEEEPSHRVLTAIRAARRHGRPVHALVLRDVTSGVDADEWHMIALDRRWETDQDLYAWGDSLQRFVGST